MRVRTQLAVVLVVAAGWAAGNMAVVHPVMGESPSASRSHIAQLESTLARDPDNVAAARELGARYLEGGMPRLLIDTMARTSAAVQRDGRVALLVARADERLGDVQAASAELTGAMNRCGTFEGEPELAATSGCDVRTETDLAIESTAVERMVAWHVTPLTDPERAEFAHELAARPIRFAAIH